MVVLYPSMALFAFKECPSMTQYCSTFAIKRSWQIVYMLTILPWLLLVIHASYELALAMVSFLNMSSCWQYAQLFMQCLVLSASSSRTCLHNSVFAMSSFLLSLNLLAKLAMFTWVPSYLLILLGLWSVRDFCSMYFVESFHSFICHDMFRQYVVCQF